jgi:predicted AlkP superfamily phosphohydrolase/phosphomutase
LRIVTIKPARGRSIEHKRKLVQEVTKAVVSKLDVKPKWVSVLISVFIFLISACGAPTATTDPASTPVNPSIAPTAAGDTYRRQGPGVIVFSLGGARADVIEQYMADGLMPNLARLVKEGVKAQYAQSVDPPLSLPAHASISSGCFPNKTGIIADEYYSPEDDFTGYVSSLDEPEMAVETVWRTAMRHGLRTAAVFWPGARPDFTEQSALRQPFDPSTGLPSAMLGTGRAGLAQDTADYTVAYGESYAPSAQHTLTFTVASGWENPPHSFSPLQEGLLRITAPSTGLRGELEPSGHRHEDALVSAINVLAVDTRDDGIANYDTFYLCRFKEIDEDSASLVEGQWAPVTVSPHLRSGAYFKITASNLMSLTNPLSPTVPITVTAPISLTVFQSQVSYNRASPVELLREMSGLFGFFPPPPDPHALQQGWITPEDYLTMAETQAHWMMEVTVHIYTTYQPDLMLTGQSALSEIVRQFLLVEERQPGYSPELAEEYAGYRKRGAQIADASLGQLLVAIDLTDTTILVVSDHGLAPVHTVVHINTILEQAGFLSFQESPGSTVDATDSKALALASGGSAHIYVNLRGREQPGLVPPEEYPALLDELVRTLSEVRDPNGQPVFARIVRRQEMADLHLSSPYSGDLFVQAEPGHVLSDEWGKEETLEPTNYYGGAGYDSALGEMHGIFVAAGHSVREGETISAVRVVDIAPTVARLLGFTPAEIVDGLALDEIIR